MELGILWGRGFEDGDNNGAPPVVVVSEALAAESFPGEEVLGRRIKVPEADSESWFTVVGVVQDLDMGGGPAAPRERVFFPFSQVPQGTALILLRSGGDAAALAPALRQVVLDTDPDLALWSVRTLADAHAYMVRVPRAMAGMASAGGVGGLLVAAAGLYGLLAFRVRRRRRELGIRMALGADGKRLAGEVLKVALRQLLPALGIGLFLAWLVAPLMGAVLLSTNPRSPGTFLVVATAFLTVGLTAALVPALRASGVEPADVLRAD